MQFRKIALAGVGLLGGSLGLALKRKGLVEKVEGLVRRSASIVECRQLRVVDEATCDPAEVARDAELIVLCTPLAGMREVLESMLPAIRPGTLITDVGSVKKSAVAELEPMARSVKAHFIGSHPMAGAEKTGPASARADLFHQAVVVVTPTSSTEPTALARIEGLWRAVEARPLRLSPEEHDELVSRTSHLPHVVAAGLAHFVLDPSHRPEQRILCAGGFRDTTRVASSSPEIWRDIVMANRENLVHALGDFTEGLRDLQRSLERGDVHAVLEFFQTARARRDDWNQRGASCPSEDP